MSGKIQKQNTEKNAQDKITEIYGDMVMEKITLTENRIERLFDLLHKIIENPFKLKSVDRLLQFNVNFKYEIEIPQFLAQIIFDTAKNEKVRITGIELKGTAIFFNYKINDNNDYRYYIDFGATKIVTKELILFKYVFENIDNGDLIEITNTLSDIINEVDREIEIVLKILKDSNVKIEN